MNPVTIQYAKKHLSSLLARVAVGEEIIITKSGKPLAKLTHLRLSSKKSIPGLDRGLMKVPDNFDDEDENINKMFK
jgi:prevent-host-death family protein